MLDKELKARIQSAYRAWLENHNFKARYGQRQMIAEIARVLSQENEPRFCVVEAGTGIGKTVAYSLAAIPVAQARGKTLIISTATVALQEQLVNKDLPDLRQHSGLEFTFALAKGRGRYLCLSKLDNMLSGQQQDFAALYPDEQFQQTGAPPLQMYESMQQQFTRGDWSGDKDSWPEQLEYRDWRLLTSDRAQCHHRRCSFITDCCYFKARDALEDADVIVTNHDLVLADLALGGGAILPAPEECIYVLDEAHHISDKAVQHFSSSMRVNGSLKWLQQLEKSFTAIEQVWDCSPATRAKMAEVLELGQQLQPLIAQLPEHVQDNMEAETEQQKPQQNLRFSQTNMPPALITLSKEAMEFCAQLHSRLNSVAVNMQEALGDTMEIDTRQALEHWFPVLGSALSRAENLLTLFQGYANVNEQALPHAWWASRIQFDNNDDVALNFAPLLGADYLQDLLWSRCAGAVLTSATLTALGNFSRLQMRSGISAASRFVSIPSPFDYAKHGVFEVPVQACDPRDVEVHSEAVADYIEQLQPVAGVLMLFASRRQMHTVYESLSARACDCVLLQDDHSKQALIDEHKLRVDAGKPSIIFGLASFAEGVDLPGDYCGHVIIAKIPFAVPDDPIEEALAEWVEAQGRNAFEEISVPDAALKLVQASGRLIRNETDTGTITLLDRRIVERRYGVGLLNSLPPYKREIHAAR
ncbi:MAG: ATP-dependent DNA helicase DinG [Pseudomonadales bacterium]